MNLTIGTCSSCKPEFKGKGCRTIPRCGSPVMFPEDWRQPFKETALIQSDPFSVSS